MAATLVFAMVACGEKENTPSESSNPGTNPETENPIKAGKFTSGSITIAGETVNNVFGMDFNNDGKLEFRISGEVPYVYLSYDYDSQNNIVNKAEQWDYIEIFGAGVPINETCLFQGYGDGSFDNFSNLPGEFYIGLRIKLTDGMHYAWAKVLKGDDQLTWSECFYNSKPDTEIKTGQKI